jgi:hypothetical protein
MLNQSGEVAGSYTGSSLYVSHGYVMDTLGNITTFDPPDSTDTFVTGINSSGEIAGYYAIGGAYYGFVRDASGSITTFTVAGLLVVAGVADNGNVYGMSRTATKDLGWKYTAAGILSYFEDPSAGPLGTLPLCVSSSDKAAGIYFDSNGDAQDFEMSE